MSNGSIIENNIICSDEYDNVFAYLFNSTVRNNYILYTKNYYCISTFYSCVVTNNIICNTTSVDKTIDCAASSYNNVIQNNILSTAEGTSGYENIPNNKFLGSADESMIFTLTGTNDQLYRLKDDSPAKGYATDGGDCGPFGGGRPYVCSGLPLYHPYITSAQVEGKPTDGKVKVSLNIKMQNE